MDKFLEKEVTLSVEERYTDISFDWQSNNINIEAESKLRVEGLRNLKHGLKMNR